MRPLGALRLVAVTAGLAAQEQLLPCEDDPGCTSWVSAADSANCTRFPGLLRLHCPLSCGACEDHTAFSDCTNLATAGMQVPRLVTSTAEHAALLEGVASRVRSQFGSRLSVLGRPGAEVLHVDGFLTAEEAGAIVQLAEASGFERGEQYIDGDALLRTSSTTFCRGACAWAAPAALLSDRISAALGIPAWHFEPVQFVRYGKGERYALHSDFIDADVEGAHGPRLLTFFVYLTEGFRGGETAFPQLGLKVQPAVGRATIWPDAFPFRGGSSGRLRWLPNSQTDHEALPVEPTGSAAPATSKYGANIWVHNGDVRRHERLAARCRARHGGQAEGPEGSGGGPGALPRGPAEALEL